MNCHVTVNRGCRRQIPHPFPDGSAGFLRKMVYPLRFPHPPFPHPFPRRHGPRPQSWRAARPQPACADGSPENFSSTSFAESTTIGSSLLSGRRSCASLEKLRGKSFQESRRQARARPRRARHDFVKKCRHMGREFQVMTSCLTLFLTLFLRKRPGKVKSAAPSTHSGLTFLEERVPSAEADRRRGGVPYSAAVASEVGFRTD